VQSGLSSISQPIQSKNSAQTGFLIKINILFSCSKLYSIIASKTDMNHTTSDSHRVFLTSKNLSKSITPALFQPARSHTHTCRRKTISTIARIFQTRPNDEHENPDGDRRSQQRHTTVRHSIIRRRRSDGNIQEANGPKC